MGVTKVLDQLVDGPGRWTFAHQTAAGEFKEAQNDRLVGVTGARPGRGESANRLNS